MAQQPDPPGRLSWSTMGSSGRQDSKDKGFDIGVCTPKSRERSDSDSGLSQRGSNSLYLVGSLSLDDASPAPDMACRSPIGSTNPPRGLSDASAAFLRSRSEEQMMSRDLRWSSSISMIPEYRNRLDRATEVGEYDHRVEGKFNNLREEVRALREQNKQLNANLKRSPGVSLRNSSMPADLSSSSSLRSAVAGTLLPAQASQEDMRKTREFMPAWGYDAVDLEATMVLVMTGHTVLRLPPQHLQSMAAAEFSQLLLRYKMLMQECCATAQRSGMDDELERKVSGLLNLTQEQKDQFNTMKQLYTCASEQLATERAALLSSATDPSGQPDRSASPSASPAVTMQAAALKQIHLQELLEKLKQNANRQNRNLRLLADGALRQVLSPLQAACAFIYSYPRAPDILAMVHTLEPPPRPRTTQPPQWC